MRVQVTEKRVKHRAGFCGLDLFSEISVTVFPQPPVVVKSAGLAILIRNEASTRMNPSTPSSDPAAGTPPITRRDFLLSAGVVAGGVLTPSFARAASSRASGSPVPARDAEAWAPHAKAAPRTARRGEAFTIAANGTRTCAGGWQWRYDGIVGGQSYEITTTVAHEDIAVPRDMLNCVAIWGEARPTQPSPGVNWDYLLPAAIDAGKIRFSRKLVAPAGAKQLVVRATLRWTASGRTIWDLPNVAIPDVAVVPRNAVRISVVTGTQGEQISMHDVFVFEQSGLNDQGEAEGHFQATGIRPQCWSRLQKGGVRLPSAMFERGSREFGRLGAVGLERCSP